MEASRRLGRLSTIDFQHIIDHLPTTGKVKGRPNLQNLFQLYNVITHALQAV